jgi:hypothetical protein
MQYSQASPYFPPLGPNILLKHPQSMSFSYCEIQTFTLKRNNRKNYVFFILIFTFL